MDWTGKQTPIVEMQRAKRIADEDILVDDVYICRAFRLVPRLRLLVEDGDRQGVSTVEHASGTGERWNSQGCPMVLRVLKCSI